MTLYDSYKKNRYKKYFTGGPLEDEQGIVNGSQPQPKTASGDNAGFAQTFQFGATMANGILDATATPDPISGRVSTGTTVGKSALSGATAGATLGPVGAGVGAVIGAGLGLLKAGKEKKEARAMIQQKNAAQARSDADRSAALLATNPSLVEGYKNSGYFAAGGFIDDPGDKNKKPVPKAYTPPAPGATYQTQAAVDAANAEAKRMAKGHNLVNPEDTYVARNVGDPIARYYTPEGKDITGMPAQNKKLATSLPQGMGYKDVQASQGMYWYNDPHTGDLVDLDPNYILGTYFPRASKEEQAMIIADRNKQVNAQQSVTTRANGGSIHIKPENRGKFTAWAKSHGMGVQEAASHVMANKEDYSGGVVKMANFAKNFGGKKEDGGPIEAPLSRMYMTGGYAKTLSSDNTEMIGNTHAQGGISIPEAGAEVENGETTHDNYIFSDKLGFAQIHKKIAKAKGIIEKKPVTPERVNSMKLLGKKENDLMLAQEYFKRQIA